jgi:mannosyltransferase OCH1-like enzyme
MQKLYLVTIFLFIFGYFNANTQNNNILDVDFMESMTDGSLIAKQLLTADPKYANYLQLFQENYEAKKPSKMPYNQEPLIPKVMHHVWIGGKDIPPLYEHYLNECKKLHPNWEFKIWGDEEVSKLGMEYKDLYDKMQNLPGKADILRYEILHRFGGVYRDMDVKCLRPIDELNHKYDFYAPLEYPAKSWKMPTINNGIIASKAGHIIPKATLDNILQNIDANWDDFAKGLVPKFLQKLDFMTIKISMLPLTHAFIGNISNNDKSIAFPATYFMPIGYNNRNERGALAKLFHLPALDKYFQFIKPETLMWHNLDKQEVELIDFDEGNGLKDPFRNRLKKRLSSNLHNNYATFEMLYKKNKAISLNKSSKIPQVINFVVFNSKEKDELWKHLSDWMMLNGDFKIKVWHHQVFRGFYAMRDIDCQEISKTFPEVSNMLESDTSENFRFYIGLKILERFGGNYAHFKAVPRTSIFELGNKYNFYAGLMPIDKTTIISLSQKLIGASVNHPIISKALIKINDLNNLLQINEIFFHSALFNIHVYDFKGYKNIVLPAIFIEPLDDLDDDCFYQIPEYIIRFFKNVPKSFTKIDTHAIVE